MGYQIAIGNFFGGIAGGISTDLIGIAGERGFGVGVASTLSIGMTALAGTTDTASDEYGNYQFEDGSIMVYVPKFFYKVGTGLNGFAVNVIDVKGGDTYASTAAANAEGYALHRAFIDGGAEKSGFFFDKYQASKRAKGTGFVASSIKNAAPISTAADHNPIAALTAVTANVYYAAIDAAHARDGVNGAINASSIFHLGSMYQYSVLSLLSLAHGQAATSTANCAWYDEAGITNFPKGNNNNALKDANDATVVYTTDGYSQSGLTGSATNFSRTTHNGMASGVTDLNGNLWELGLGMTAIAAGKTITGATQANPCVVTVTAHGYTTGTKVQVESVGGMTQINNIIHTITVVDANSFSLDGVNATAYTAYTTGGAATTGTFYAAKQATAMKSFTSGNTSSTDNWGSTGVAAMMDAVTMPLGGPFAYKLGTGANQVFGAATGGGDWVRTGLGLPKDSTGISSAGTNLFGTDYYYQYVRNELFPVLGGHWSYGSTAGVFARYWSVYRASSSSFVGFRCSTYGD